MPVGWQAIIIDRNGVARQYISPRGLRLRTRLNGYAEASCSVDLSEGDTAEVIPGARGIRLLRNGVVRFQGQIVSPVSYSAGPVQTTVNLTAWSPFGALTRRFVKADISYNDDAGAIAEDLLDLANAEENTHLRIGSVDTSTNRSVVYETGKQIGESIEQLANAFNGFWFREEFVSEGDVWAALNIQYPSPGTDRGNARFSFGEGTIDSVREFGVEAQLPTNDVIAIGALDQGEEGQPGKPLVSTFDDAASISEYGLWGAVVNYSDVSVQETLDAHAEEAVEASPPVIYSVRPLPSTMGDDRPVPRLWDDFDIGDTVRLTLRANAPFDVIAEVVRVTSVTLSVSDNAQTETIDEISFEAP